MKTPFVLGILGFLGCALDLLVYAGGSTYSGTSGLAIYGYRFGSLPGAVLFYDLIFSLITVLYLYKNIEKTKAVSTMVCGLLFLFIFSGIFWDNGFFSAGVILGAFGPVLLIASGLLAFRKRF